MCDRAAHPTPPSLRRPTRTQYNTPVDRTLSVFGVGSPRRARCGASGCAERVSSPRRRSKASCSDVNKTRRFKTKAKTKTEGHKTKTKTIGPITTTYSLPTVNEIIFYSTVFYNLCTQSTSYSNSHESVKHKVLQVNSC